MRDRPARRFSAALIAVALTLGSALATQAAPPASDGIDALVRPGDDFYNYANGPWARATHLPDGAARVDTTSLLRADNANRVRVLIEDAARGGQARSPLARMVGDYYASRLDTAAIEARGLAPLAADLAAIAAIDNRRALAGYLGHTVRLGDGGGQDSESLWGVWIHQGFHDPDHYAAHLVQGGLGLPDLDDYLSPTPEHAAHRDLYRAHIAGLLRAAGLDQPELRAGRVLTLEAAIAATHASRADTDDVLKTDNNWRRADFAAKAPGLDWDAWFMASGLSRAKAFVVWQPRAVTASARLVGSEPLLAWKDYLAFHLITHFAAVLPAAIGDERRAFAARLAGEPSALTPDPRQEATAATQAALGEAVGQLYVARYVAPGTKAAATAMVENIRLAFRDHIADLAWMSPETKAKAGVKLDALRVGLAYPETWPRYERLTIVSDDAYGNLRRTETFSYDSQVAKLSRPVDPDEWAAGLNPQTVGAVINFSPNAMQFSAGILQPPYFDPAGDPAANYGSAGAGLAHEISHSFDELGNLYDAHGNLGPWWTPADVARYRAAAAPLAIQLDSCCPTPDACARGPQILGESTADLAGLAVAHDAYLLSLHGRPAPVIGGLTGEQRFFIAFAQRWRRVQTPAALARQIATDSHAPPACRAGLVRNDSDWTRAFGVRPGDRLYLSPEARTQIW